MVTAIDALRAAGTGPARLRAALRRKTRTLVRSLPAPVGSSGVATRFPDGVLGDSLVALFSERLRELLQNPPPTQVETELLGRGEPDWSAPAGVTSPARLPAGDTARGDGIPAANRWDDPLRAARDRAVTQTAPRSAPDRRVPLPGMDTGRESTAAAPLRSALPIEAGPGAPVQGGRFGEGQGADVVRSHPAPAPSLLSEKLREYWELMGTAPRPAGNAPGSMREDGGATRQERRAPAGTGSASRPGHRGGPVAGEEKIARGLAAFAGQQAPGPQAAASPFDGSAAAQASLHSWTGLDDEMARRLRAFVSDEAYTPAPRDFLTWASGPEVQAGPEFGRQVAPAAADFTDLADALAAILREQALQHGIDVS